MTVTPPTSSKQQLPLLTEARGIAALLVVHVHLLLWYLPLLREASVIGPGIVRYGWLAVDFFFILSGFVLAHVYHDKFARPADWRQFGPFIRARFARVYPLHLVTSTGFLLLSAMFSGSWQWGLYLHDLFLVNALPKLWPLNVPSWSIGAEAVTYFLAPLMIALSARVPRALLFPAMAASGGFLGYMVLGRWGGHDYHSVFRCIPEFFSGVLLYQEFRRRPLPARGAKLMAAGSVLLLALIPAFSLPQPLDTLSCLGPIALLVLALPQLPSEIVRRCSGRPIRFLGDISYSIYLIHPLILLFVPSAKVLVGQFDLSELGKEFLIYLIVISAVLFCAWVTYRTIELPFRRRLRPAPRLLVNA